MTEHVTITDPEIHEPKGVAAASADEVYVADGAGSGSWEILNPYGGIIYNDIGGTGTTFTTPSTYTILDLVTASTNLNGFSTNNLGRLTYTGAEDRHVHAVFDASFDHSTGAGNEVTFGVYKNGLLLSNFEAVGTADSSTTMRMVLHFDNMISTNDYFEVYAKTASGSITVYTFYLFLMGMPG
jgi:hypothetical protein